MYTCTVLAPILGQCERGLNQRSPAAWALLEVPHSGHANRKSVVTVPQGHLYERNQARECECAGLRLEPEARLPTVHSAWQSPSVPLGNRCS